MKDMKAYLFITDTDFKNGRLTGSHKRFLELVRGVVRHSTVILISSGIPQIQDLQQITCYETRVCGLHLPAHLRGMVGLFWALKKNKKRITYDYAISFHATSTICYRICGYKNIVTLFREDLVGYQQSLGVSGLKLNYFRILEKLAVKASIKIVVQCKNDRKNLIERNKRLCKDIEHKVFIQINNSNASWMDTDAVEHLEDDVSTVKILFIGNFSNERKGHKQLLPAIARLIDEIGAIKLYVAGDGKQLEECREKYKKYPQIIFLERVNEMKKYLSMCDFEVVPSLIDSCPNAVLEGINAGIAVYGANRGGIPDLLQSSEYMFIPDEIHIYDFLKQIIGSRRYKYDAIKQRERKEALTFDWSKRIEEIIECKNGRKFRYEN